MFEHLHGFNHSMNNPVKVKPGYAFSLRIAPFRTYGGREQYKEPVSIIFHVNSRMILW